MSKIIYKQMDKSDALNSTILSLLQQYELEDAHITLEKRKNIFSVKASIGRYVVSKKDHDVYLLAEKVIHTLHKQIKEYERKKFDIHKRFKKEVYTDEPLQKIKKFIIKPMSRSNALEHMQLLGHQFYLYIDTENKPSMLFEKDGEIYSQTSFATSSIEEAVMEVFENESKHYFPFIDQDENILTVVYKRKTGDVGIIEASMS